jgi:putative ABC transport system permease protein
LGIVIGVAAVILLVSVSQSAGLMVQQQFQSLGTNMLIVIPGSQNGGGVRKGLGSLVTLTAADAEAMVAECPAVLAAAPIVAAKGAQVVAGNQNWSPDQIIGVNASYLTVRNWQIEKGDFFTKSDEHAAAKICVIGATVAENLFQTKNGLGATIRIKNIPFQVAGLLEAKGANMFGQDQDNIVLAPWSTITKRVSGSTFNNVDVILVSARSADLMDEVESQVKLLLRQRHRIRHSDEDDFTVRNTSEVLNVLRIITLVMTLLLGSVASVSLVVGGVGIMNIMLVSVTERTREIGIRLAVGARSRDILRQFLVEAVVLSTLGGLIGIALGVAAAVATTAVVNAFWSNMRWPLSISVEAIVVALVFSGSVGMFFGYYPARKASRLDPIESLRYE